MLMRDLATSSMLAALAPALGVALFFLFIAFTGT